ncbi:BMP family ABC transporter substrate-binding protein [bacterium]|nr:BMP family ABC transporter substrate-binding protein [bacterium]MDY3861083.1 BMP family ABC transporter substrate-binding protein [Ruminococcus sp.]
MFKKLLSVVLAALMVFSLAAVVAGCGSETKSDSLKFGFIYLHDENSTYDNNFLTAAKEACEKMGVEMINKTNIDESDACKEAALDLVDQGCGIIFADSFGHEDFMIEAAKANPDVQFLHATGTKAHTEKLDNFHNAFASIYEGRYLAGVAAGMKINEMIESGQITADQAKMGYVGAHPYAEVKSGYTSFYLGAKSVCPSVTMDVTFTGSWYDETLEKEAANKLIADGCVLISQHADSMGAPTACEAAGVPNVSYNGSTVNACPNTFIVSSKINWEPYFEYAIKCVQEGKAIDTDWTGTIATGSVELTEVNEKAAAKGTQEAIDAAKAGLESGKINVFDTANFTVKGEALTSYMADVDSDAEFKGDTEVVKDGVFEESKYRSAPYFDVDIDGISVIE